MNEEERKPISYFFYRYNNRFLVFVEFNLFNTHVLDIDNNVHEKSILSCINKLRITSFFKF